LFSQRGDRERYIEAKYYDALVKDGAMGQACSANEGNWKVRAKS